MPTEREIQMLRAAREAGITSREELANFMAQISAESRNLTRLEEGFAYTRGVNQIPPRWARRNGLEALEDARQEALRGNAEPLAELMYGGRMGNNDPGDGYRYRGRGYIQLTGRDNYTAASRALDLDLVGSPDLAAQPENAARVAVWYWQERVPPHQREDVLEATHRVNGGEEGLARRYAEFGRWNAVLTPELLADLDANRLIPDAHQVRGIEDSVVQSLQENLNTLGIRNARGEPLVVDGNRGGPNSNTNEAIAAFQRQFGLTGVISNAELLAATQAALNARQALNPDQPRRDVPHPEGVQPPAMPARNAPGRPGDVLDRYALPPTQAAEPIRLPPMPPVEQLQPGAQGAAVFALQEHLRLLNARDAEGQPIKADRDYGDRTRAAVEDFQLWSGLPTTGVADRATLDALKTHAAFALEQRARGIAPSEHLAGNLKPGAPEAHVAADLRTPAERHAIQDPAAFEQGRTLAAVQTGLIQLGYQHRIGQPLQVNGVNDEATREAVTAFQSERNLPVTGQPDAATQQALQQLLAAQQQATQAREKEKAQGQAQAVPTRTPADADHPVMPCWTRCAAWYGAWTSKPARAGTSTASA